jgi:hypothetical protein
MADEIHQAPRAPQPTVAPAPMSPTAANFSRPTTSSAAAQNATPTVPSTTPLPPTAPVQTNTTAQPNAAEESQTLNERLNTGDRYWKFKTALQAIAIIIGLIGIGTLGWCFSNTPSYGFSYGYDSTWSLWPSFITFSCSIIWCVACIGIFVFRKRPVHPGLRVAIDLLLWLGFIATALLALVSFFELSQWADYGDMGNSFGQSSRYGDYELAPNGTWVWQQDPDRTSTSYLRPCESNSTRSNYYYGPTFDNCADQDAYINQLWREKPHRESVQLTGVVCQFFGLVLHLMLFIWACVDCHRHNRKKVSKDAEKLAANIVQTMITNGAVIPPPGQAHLRPWPQGYYQLPPQHQQNGQAYPMTAMYPQQSMAGYPQQGMAGQMGPQGGYVAGPSNEKSEGPRYA